MHPESDRWYNRIVRDSRYNDRRRNRFIDPSVKYIDRETLLEFQDTQENKCYYCGVQMNWLQRRSGKTGLTLEREKNHLPHYKSNCLGLCCKSCNCKRYQREHGLLVRYFTKWKNLALNVHVKSAGGRGPSFASWKKLPNYTQYRSYHSIWN